MPTNLCLIVIYITSVSCVRATTVQIQFLSGKYYSDYLVSKWTGDCGKCLLKDCGFYPGDVEHLLSSSCPALSPYLQENLKRSLYSVEDFPDLFRIVKTAFDEGPSVWCSLLVDPSTYPPLIRYMQLFGSSSIYPVMKLCRSYIWCMHRTRKRLQQMQNYVT